MRISDSRRHSSVGFNMTPMIDVVFQLIIFFLVAGHFGSQEMSVEMELPKAAGGSVMTDQETLPRLTVSIPENGGLFLGSREVTEEELTHVFSAEKKRLKDAAFQLRIRAAKSVPYQKVEPILKSAARTGIRDVQFAVVP